MTDFFIEKKPLFNLNANQADKPKHARYTSQ